MNKEFEFLNIISQTLTNSSYLGDDCAYLDEYKIALSKDVLIEDVHFSLSYMTPYEIGKKALLVNISDVLASAAVPKYALIGLSGKLTRDFIKEFYKGIDEIAIKYNVKIIGGDLTGGDKISVSITILGDYKNSNISSRKNAKPEYIVAVCGEFGSAIQGFNDLTKGLKDNYFIKYHKEPLLYPETSTLIAKNTSFPFAMMDSSDGLIDCLYQISTGSNVKIEIDFNKVPHKTDNKDFVLYGGEDYSLVACLHKDDFEKITDLIPIGVCKKGSGVYVGNKKTEYKGFKHFD